MKKSTYLAFAMTGVLLASSVVSSAWADSDEEKQKVAQCAKDICSMIVSKDANGPDLSCDLTRTWEKDEIQKGADSKKLTWGLGSARCSVKVSVKRADIAAALTSADNVFKGGKQSVACEIGTEKYAVSVTMAPELTYKNGTNTAVALHIADIKVATLIKGVVWSAATLEQHFGILHSDMIREVNRFVQKECPKIAAGTK